MKKNFIVTLVLILITINCFSQNNWKPGYIIKISGDTIFGYIDLRNSQSNSEHCYFREEEIVPVHIYSPQELLGYRFLEGKFFISKNLKDLGFEKTVFLEFLIKGKLNVYHFRDNLDHYFVEKDNIYYELKNTKEIVQNETVNYEIERKEYLGLLNALLEDSNMQPEIMRSKLKPKSLINIAKTYHEKVCFDEECVIYEMKDELAYIVFSPHIGVTFNKLTFGNVLTTNFCSGYTIGGKFEIINAVTWLENISIELGFAFQQFKNYDLKIKDGDRASIGYNNEYYTIWERENEWTINHLNVNLDAIALKVPISAKYTFSKSRVQPYIGAGFMNMVIISQNEDFIYSIFYDEYNKSIPTYNIGLLGKFGAKYKLNDKHAIYIELNYEQTLSPNVNQHLRFKNNLYSVNLGFDF